jgi:putative CocE/NonD family hydrolase
MYFISFIALLLLLGHVAKAQISADLAWMKENYEKKEMMIPMRDGIQLFTTIYQPRHHHTNHPILMSRTPYSCAPYGKDFRANWSPTQMMFARQQYFFVFQDVRGRFMSEGQFEDVRPFNPNKQGDQTDEASDTYDTIDWLVKNLEHNNGKVGVAGISYPGFYSTMAALSGHPALKAVSPQAPVTDWFMGDDFHHNGAFMLMDAFNFYKGFGVPRPAPTTRYNPGYNLKETDKYRFYLKSGPLSTFTHQYLGDTIQFWNDLMHHPNLDTFWQVRNVRNFVSNLKPAMLVVGGNFDAEDCFGAWNLYKAIEEKNLPSAYNKIVMGPWSHGAWGGRSTGENLGKARFGSKTTSYYHQNIEYPFFQHFLHDGPVPSVAEATVFFTGENSWKQFNQWPPTGVREKSLFLQPGGKLDFEHPAPLAYRNRPDTTMSFTEYVADPAKPVPYEGADTIRSRTNEYMAADQRFASLRNDVATFTSEILGTNITVAGPLYADLMISTTGTDADFVVKLIDILPDTVQNAASGPDTVYSNKPFMNGYQMLVRGEVMRGRFRNSFEKPEPFVPNKITKVRFYLPDVAHTFLKGHRIMVQVQSSWFPLVDRNPNKFVDMYNATDQDFQKASIRIFHTEGVASKLLLPVVSD